MGASFICGECRQQVTEPPGKPCPKCGSTLRIVDVDMGVTHYAEAHIAGSATIRVDTIVIRFSELPRALTERRTDIVLRVPALVPTFIFLALVYMCIQLYAQDRLSTEGMRKGYNVEQCDNISVKGVDLSRCVRLTKPTTPSEPRP
jgi:hypothetical protein